MFDFDVNNKELRVFYYIKRLFEFIFNYLYSFKKLCIMDRFNNFSLLACRLKKLF